MSFPRILAITGRIIAQFRRDHRTLGLIFVAPILVMTLFGYVFRSQEDTTIKVAVVNEDQPTAGQASLAAPIIDSLKTNNRLVLTNMQRDDADKRGARRHPAGGPRLSAPTSLRPSSATTKAPSRWSLKAPIPGRRAARWPSSGRPSLAARRYSESSQSPSAQRILAFRRAPDINTTRALWQRRPEDARFLRAHLHSLHRLLPYLPAHQRLVPPRA